MTIKVPFTRSWNEQFIGVFDGFKYFIFLISKVKTNTNSLFTFFLPDTKDGLLA
jgi:hypothetical protein